MHDGLMQIFDNAIVIGGHMNVQIGEPRRATAAEAGKRDCLSFMTACPIDRSYHVLGIA